MFINKWETKKFVRIIIAFQLAIIGLVSISTIGYNLPIIRQFVGFIYLTFIPGLVILRILKVNKLGTVETVLYSVGLSIAFVMGLGFLMNMFYPLIGISKPISIFPVTVTLFLTILILCVIIYMKEFHEEIDISQPHINYSFDLLNPATLFLLSLPLISIFGTYFVNSYQNNILLLFLIPFITLITVLIIFDKFIPPNLYPLSIVLIGVSLIWHWSLISIGLTGYDIHHEYYFQNLVLINSIWDYSLSSNVNSMLSITMLAPIFSLVLDLDTVWIFKIIYPIFFSLVPLALFEVYRKQTDDKIAFLSVFFFMSLPVFFTEMIQLARQQIAELFFALSILLLINKEIPRDKRALLLIIFSFSIVTSHYGLSYIYMIYLFIALPLLFIWNLNLKCQYLEKMVKTSKKFNYIIYIKNISQKLVNGFSTKSACSFIYIMIFLVFCISWYMYIGYGSAFDSAGVIVKHIYESLSTEFFSLEARDTHIIQAIGLSPMRGGGIEWKIARIFQQITQICIVFGIVSLMFNQYKAKFHIDFAIFSLISMVVIAMSIILPHFSAALNMSRIYHITLFFLAPFCILGGKVLFQFFFKAIHSSRFHHPNVNSIKLVAILILVPYFLFATGFIFQLTGATPTSMPLALHQDDWLFPTYSEAYTSKWLENNHKQDINIYVDEYGGMLLRFQGMIEGSMKSSLHLPGLPKNPENIENKSYIFLRRWNVLHNKARSVEVKKGIAITSYIDLDDATYSLNLNNRDKIYENGNAQVLGFLKSENRGDLN